LSFQTIHGDITIMKTDAIVNAANTSLRMGGGVCGAIFRKAGPEELQKACDAIGGCPVGQAVITRGYRLPAAYVIHTVGPVWQGGSAGEEDLLRACYRNSLALAQAHGLSSVAFPLISAGIFGYPKEAALKIARETIVSFLETANLDVYLVLFNAS
jgi:O-acetyl-ADP-ribose deacetylase (regulator of RNase III)